MHDPRLGRFFAVDPLTQRFPHNSPYAFSENRVIDALEFEGLEKVTMMTVSFAPFDVFGYCFIGNGSDRKFGEGMSNYKVAGSVTVDLATGESVVKEMSSVTVQVCGLTPVSVGELEVCSSPSYMDVDVSKSEQGKWQGQFHNYGNNCAVTGSCDVDVYGSYTLNYNGKSKWLYVSGNTSGDKFPANEQILKDAKGVKIILGVTGVDSKNANTAPFVELCGNSTNEDMSNWSLHIKLDNDGNFSSVMFNKKEYSIDAWNKQFTSLSPADPSVNTDVNTSTGKFETKEE